MKLSLTTSLVYLPAVLAVCASSFNIEKRGIDAALYDDLKYYFKYATSSYAESCPNPNGNVNVLQFSNPLSDTQGFIARDDNRKEIVVSFRGSESNLDTIIDFIIFPVPFISQNVKAPEGTLVHAGFLFAWNSVAYEVIATVEKELEAHPGYTLATTGHSLGGALSSIAAITLKQNFPEIPIRMFTYAQPRVFNAIGAEFINSQFGDSVYRSTHTNDGVPTMLPQFLGYHHFAYEYWQNPDPADPSTVKKCDASGEDPTCSNSFCPSEGINTAHFTYYGIGTGMTFCS